jgi:hypothetical protein
MLMVVSGLALMAPLASAQESPKTNAAIDDYPDTGRQVQTAWRGDWTLTLGGGGQHAFAADLDNAGEVSVTRAEGDLTLAFRPAEKLRMTVGIEGEGSFYDFDGATGIIAGTDDPWDELYQANLNTTMLYTLDDRWSILGAAFVGAGFESGADLGESISGGGLVGAGYAFSPSFTLRFGGGVRTQLEDDVQFIPVLDFDWKISEKLSLRTQGLGLRFTAKLSDEFAVYMGGSYESRQYRLDEDRDLLPSGVVRDRSVPIGVGVVWTPLPGLSLVVEGGAVVWQEYEVLNERGIKRGEDETDPAPFVGVRLEYRF